MKSRTHMQTGSPLAHRLFLASRDMEEVKRYLNAYRELHELDCQSGRGMYFDHREAILVAAIVAYCRPFKKAYSDGKADSKIDIKHFSKVESSPELLALHNLVVDLRDKAIAHGDWSHRSTQLIGSGGGTSIMRKAPIPKIDSALNFEEFENLAAIVCQECLRLTHELDLKSINDSSP